MLLVARCNNAPTGEIQLKYTDTDTPILDPFYNNET